MNGNFKYYTDKVGEYYKDRFNATNNIYKLTSYDTWRKIYTAKNQFGDEWVITYEDLITRLEYLPNTKALKILFGTNTAL